MVFQRGKENCVAFARVTGAEDTPKLRLSKLIMPFQQLDTTQRVFCAEKHDLVELIDDVLAQVRVVGGLRFQIIGIICDK